MATNTAARHPTGHTQAMPTDLLTYLVADRRAVWIQVGPHQR